MENISSVLAELGDRSLLGIIPGLSELIHDAGNIRLFSRDGKVIQQGNPIEYLVIPLDGPLKLVRQTDPANSNCVGYLSKHQALALGELIRGEVYPYGAVADTTTRVLFLPKNSFLQLLRGQEDALHYLKLMTASSGLRSFKNFLIERRIDPKNVVRIFKSIEAAEETVEAGKEFNLSTPGLIFLREGRVRIESGAKDSAWSLELGEGAWFGGEAVVSPFRISYRAVALTPVKIHSAPMSRIAPELKALKLIEAVHADPWITRQASGRTRTADLPLSSLPGQLLPESEAVHLPPRWRDRLQSASSDSESFSASLLNFTGLLGVNANLAAIDTELSLARKITPLRLAEILDSFGLPARSIRSNVAGLKQQLLPALTMLGPRLVILLHADGKRKRVVFHDPARGLVGAAYSEIEPGWGGVIIEAARSLIEAGPSEKESSSSSESKGSSPVRRLSWDALYRLIRPFQGILWNVLALNLLAIAIRLVIPLLSQHVLDEVLSLRDVVSLETCVAGLVIAALLLVLIRVAGEYGQAEFGLRFDWELSTQFYRHALSLPAQNFSRQKTGDILQRISAIGHIRYFLSGTSIQAVISLLSLCVYFFVLCFYALPIALCSAAVLLTAGLGQFLVRKLITENYEKSFDSNMNARSLLAEQVSSIATVKSTGSEATMRKRWEAAYLDVIDLDKKTRMTGISLQVGMDMVSGVALIVAVWIAARMAMQKALSPGEILAVSLYVSQMVTPISTLSAIMMSFIHFRVSTHRLEELLDRANEEGSVQGAQVKHSFALRGKIRLDGVSFRYSEDTPWILKDLNLTLYPRQVTAIVGRSGCGKSTLANLLAVNLKPTAGRVFFDDFDSQYLSVSSLRKQIGFVMQESELFSGHLGGNIGYADDSWEDDLDLVWEAVNNAGADFIEKIHRQLGYVLGESGMGLSGGERQRISIARTFFRNPRILLLDEASSALDAITEKTLSNNLRKVLKDKTAIVIAHRLSTVRSADRIIVLDEGRIVEEGSHSELLDRGGHYLRLFRNQLQGQENA